MATSQSVLHHDVLLSNYVQHWKPAKDVPWYLHDELFPLVPVDKASNAFKIINQQTFMQTAKAKVGPHGDVSQVQAYYDPEGSYKAVPYALDGVIDHLERAEADDVALYEQLQTDLPMVVLKNTLELEAYNQLFTTGNLGSNYEVTAVGDMFDNYSSITANPMLYIREKCERIMNITGRKVNFCAMDRLTWRALKFNPATLAFLAVHAPGNPLQDLTIELFEKKLEDVMEKGSLRIAHFRYDQSRAKVAQSSLSPHSAIGPNLVIARLDPPSKEDISATKQFGFTGNMDLGTGAKLVTAGGDAVGPEIATAPISAFTYPIYGRGQRGATGVRVITNRDFRVTRPTSLWVSFGVVDKTNTSLYGVELQ